MKTYYQCETCGKKFNDAESAEKCEKFHAAELEKKKRLNTEKKERSKKIEELLQSYINDYHEYPKITVSGYQLGDRLGLGDLISLMSLI